MLLSIVNGHWIKVSPAKTRIPILSCFLFDIKLLAVFFVASNLFGGKSVASMEELISSTRTMSTISTFFSTIESMTLGLARAKIRSKIIM